VDGCLLVIPSIQSRLRHVKHIGHGHRSKGFGDESPRAGHWRILSAPCVPPNSESVGGYGNRSGDFSRLSWRPTAEAVTTSEHAGVQPLGFRWDCAAACRRQTRVLSSIFLGLDRARGSKTRALGHLGRERDRAPAFPESPVCGRIVVDEDPVAGPRQPSSQIHGTPAGRQAVPAQAFIGQEDDPSDNPRR
jgi:hypothetical protein